MNIDEIEKSIIELENSPATYNSCQKLASLYIVKKYFPIELEVADEVVAEYTDILPAYKKYREVKKHYQMNDYSTSEDTVLYALQDALREIKEFLLILYSSTDFQAERECIQSVLADTISTILDS